MGVVSCMSVRWSVASFQEVRPGIEASQLALGPGEHQACPAIKDLDGHS